MGVHGNAGPHFIGVGPEKTGTTWLFQNLVHHPDVWLVPVKETCFFYESALYPGERWTSRLALKRDWHHQRYWNYLIRRPGHLIKYPSHILEFWRAYWDWRYLFDVHDDAWYQWAFKFAKSNQIAGEISPPYFFMPERGIEHMRQLVPDVRIIIFIRNPIDWRWSFAKMDLMKNRGRGIDQVAPAEFTRFLDVFRDRSFAKTLEIWRKHFPAEQLFICFFDELTEEPARVFEDVCAFLGVDHGRLPAAAAEQLARRVNAGRTGALPPAVAERLVADSRQDIEDLGRMFDTYPARWQAQLAGELMPTAG